MVSEVTQSSDSETFNKLNPQANLLKLQSKAEHTNFILEVIKQNQPISLYDLEKKTDTPHTTLFFICRDMEFAGLVYSKKKINDQNRIIRLFYTTKKYKLQKESAANTADLNSNENLGVENG